MPNALVIVPCFNEGSRLQSEAFCGFATSHTNVSFCFVDDGSTDNTMSVLRKIQADAPDRISILTLARNHGKAEAVRAGIKAGLTSSHFDFVGYWDADLATPLAEIDRFLEVARKQPGVILLAGSRIRKLGSEIPRRPLRHYLGRIHATIVSRMLHLPVYDTQCGAKLFESRLAEEVFCDPFISKWLFDVELFARAIQARGQHVILTATYEIPLRRWKDIGGSKVALWDFCRAPRELWQIYLTYCHRRKL